MRFALLLAAAAPLFAADGDAARAVLASRCWACHAESAAGGLRLDSREAMLTGGKSGPAIVPGDPSKSRLFRAISRTAGYTPMPPAAPLPPAEIETLAKWIADGAPWSGSAGHWAFQPLRKIQPGDSIDGFIDSGLRAKGLKPAPPADDRTLPRRLAFDLTGLPPVGQSVDRLLNSPQFGEQWGRHWLDIARFGEDDFSGTAVQPYENAWRYRDWVIGALNRDLPYDRFLMAQLAGDLMNDPSLIAATGFTGAGPWYYGIAQPAQSRADERHDRVDVVSRGMLGVTLACARCHDHKYDPFTAHDYYALAGVFASTAYKEYPLVAEAEVEAWKKQKAQVDAAEKALNQFLDAEGERLAKVHSASIADYMTGGPGLHPKVAARWTKYLAKREEFHPFLNRWFDGEKTRAEAEAFAALLAGIIDEKNAVDLENKRIVEEAKKTAPKVSRTIVLPGGYRSEEDFNPGAHVPAKSLPRDRFVAWNRIYGEKDSPLKFPRDLTPDLLEPDKRAEYDRLHAAFESLKKALPKQYPFVLGAGEFDPIDLNFNIRGNPEQLGEIVPRRFPLALSGGREIPLNQGSGRLQLAETIAHHPLAARVAANRVWMVLFGQGLVRTPSNFGRVGDRPVHPELLDYLAGRLILNGYSIKSLIREIVASDAYRRASTPIATNEAIDPANRYFWRQNRRRLAAEPLRDAMLDVAGELDRSTGGPSAPLTDEFRRRTVYARTSRFQQDETLSLFDLPSASVTCEQRVVTNVPLQKLFFLNSPFVDARAAALAKRFGGSVDTAYRLLFQRPPSARERELTTAFIAASGETAWTQYAKVLLSSNEFAYVD